MKRDSRYKSFLSNLEIDFGNATSADKLVSGNKYIHGYPPYVRNEDQDRRFYRGNCPWCGFNDIDIEKDKHGKGWAVQCCNCGAVSPIGWAEKEGALMAWNFGCEPYYYKFILDKFAVIGAMATTGGDAEEAARLLGVTVDFINERF